MSAISDFVKYGPVLTTDTPGHSTSGEALLCRLAILVGVVAFFLPIVLFTGAQLAGTCMRDSISHFYYAPFLGAAFVGMLFFIGGFLVAYTGDHWLEIWGSNIAAAGAFGVALFPTTGTGCEEATFVARVFAEVINTTPFAVSPIPTGGYFELFGETSKWHQVAAGIVFVYLGLFCLFVLRRCIEGLHIQNGQLLPSKARRNRIYTICGIVILLCVLVLFLKSKGDAEFLEFWNRNNLTFYVEAVALWAFGFAWFTKGRPFSMLDDANYTAFK
ncbi:MAG: hypothetical protein AAGF53_05400 [Pseudomonadota bacterium]